MYIQNTVGQLQLSRQERATPFGQLAASLENIVGGIVSAFTAPVGSAEQMAVQLLGPELPAFIASLTGSAERLRGILQNTPQQGIFLERGQQLGVLIQEAIAALQAIRASAEMLSTLDEDRLRERLDTNESLLRRAEFAAENPASAAGYQGLMQTGWAWVFGTLAEIRQGAEAEVAQLTQTINRLRRDIGEIESQRQSAYRQIAEQKSNSILKLIQVGELAKGIVMGLTDTDRIQGLLRQHLPDAGQLRERTSQATQAVRNFSDDLQAFTNAEQLLTTWSNRLDVVQTNSAQLDSRISDIHSNINSLRSMYGELATRNVLPPPLQPAQQGGAGLGLILVGLLLIGGLTVIFLPTIVKKIQER